MGSNVLDKVLFGLKPNTWVAILAYIGFSLIMASRAIYIALDDGNYIAYFELIDFPYLTTDSLYNYLLDEPLWNLYAWFMGSIFDSEVALRITIFFSTFIFLFSTARLTNQSWLWVFLVFVIDGSLGTQLYFNQIRQGVALSLFILIIANGLPVLLAMAIASLIHTSFVVTLVPILVVFLFKNKSWIIAIATIIISIIIAKVFINDIDFGRRDNYEIRGALTIYYYIVNIFIYGLLFYFLRKNNSEKQTYWFYFTFTFMAFVLFLTLIHEASARLMYVSQVFVSICIGLHLKEKFIKNIALFWLLFLLALQINETRKTTTSFDDTYFGRWSLIINGK